MLKMISALVLGAAAVCRAQVLPCISVEIASEAQSSRENVSLVVTNISNHDVKIVSSVSPSAGIATGYGVITLKDSSGNEMAETDAGRMANAHSRRTKVRNDKNATPELNEGGSVFSSFLTLKAGEKLRRERNTRAEFAVIPGITYVVEGSFVDPCTGRPVNSPPTTIKVPLD